MPLDKLFRKAAEEDEAADAMYALELREEIVALREELELYDTLEWKKVDELLAKKLEANFRDMMVGEPDQMILARERARVVSDLRATPERLREKIADLTEQLRLVEGE